MASFSFGFQLSEEGYEEGATGASSSTKDRCPSTAPFSGRVVPARVIDHITSPGALERLARREVPIGIGPPLYVIENVTHVMKDVPAGVDLIPGVYEGGLKVWESSVDLAQCIRKEDGLQIKKGQKVLELGCGHGLPGISALQQGADVCFMDLNEEVLRGVTRWNIELNLSTDIRRNGESEVLLISGEWTDASEVLRQQSACTTLDGDDPRFDVILTAETIYTNEVTDKLLVIIKRHLQRPHGIALVAGKRYYFGTGGSVADLIDKATRPPAGSFNATVLSSVQDGRSNIRDIVQLSWRM